jgi:hypothetical protein
MFLNSIGIEQLLLVKSIKCAGKCSCENIPLSIKIKTVSNDQDKSLDRGKNSEGFENFIFFPVSRVHVEAGETEIHFSRPCGKRKTKNKSWIHSRWILRFPCLRQHDKDNFSLSVEKGGLSFLPVMEEI